MSRFHEGDGENPIGLVWCANFERVCRGKRGQKLLREFVTALLALPERRLIADKLQDCRTGDVCAVGALAKYRGALPEGQEGEGDDLTREVGEAMGLGFMLTWEMGYRNDEHNPPPYIHTREVKLDEPIVDEYRARDAYRYGRQFSPRVPVVAPTTMWGTEKVWSERGVMAEERWMDLYRWACSKIRWNLPAVMPQNKTLKSQKRRSGRLLRRSVRSKSRRDGSPFAPKRTA